MSHNLIANWLLLICLCVWAGCTSSTSDKEEVQEEQAYTGNPILPGDFADPFILQHQDTFYIYPTTGGF